MPRARRMHAVRQRSRVRPGVGWPRDMTGAAARNLALT